MPAHSHFRSSHVLALRVRRRAPRARVVERLANIFARTGRCGALPEGQTNNPFPQPIARDEGVITVTIREFASLPEIAGVAARMMTLVDEPTSRRLFVSDMRGQLYAVSAEGKIGHALPRPRRSEVGRRRAVAGPRARDAELRAAPAIRSARHARVRQALHLHGRLEPDASAGLHHAKREHDARHRVARMDGADAGPRSTYDGEAPRELIRLRQPFANHNGGAVAFNSTARPGAADFGLLYMGVADGGSGGDPMNLAQNLGSAFGKIFRIDPLGKNGRDGKYGIPAANPIRVDDGRPAGDLRVWRAQCAALCLGLQERRDVHVRHRPEHRRGSEPGDAPARTLAGTSGRAAYRYISRQAVSTESPRSDPKVTYPIVEWDQLDPVLLPNNSSASVSLVVYRSTTIPQLTNRMLFGDMPSGEVFHVSADELPRGGQDAIRRVLFVTAAGAAPRTLLEIIQEKNRAQGKTAATRGRPAIRRDRGRTDLPPEQGGWDDSCGRAVRRSTPCATPK